jgi:hypothetical protein
VTAESPDGDPQAPLDPEELAAKFDGYPVRHGPWRYPDLDRADGPADLPALFEQVAASTHGFTLGRLSGTLVGNDIVVAPARHPALALWLEVGRASYARSEAAMFGGVGRLLEDARKPGRSTWAWAITPARSGRLHHLLLQMIGLSVADLDQVWPAVTTVSELSWLTPRAGEITLPAGDDHVVTVLKRCLSYLRWQVLTREGNLHLSGVASVVRGLPDPGLAWTALLAALPAVAADLPAITSVTDLRRNPDGSFDQVELPPEAEALLDRAAEPREWLGTGQASGRVMWLLDERVTPVRMRAVEPARAGSPRPPAPQAVAS